jgi:hypothetical protein
MIHERPLSITAACSDERLYAELQNPNAIDRSAGDGLEKLIAPHKRPGDLISANGAASVDRLVSAAVRLGNCYPKVVAASGAVPCEVNGQIVRVELGIRSSCAWAYLMHHRLSSTAPTAVTTRIGTNHTEAQVTQQVALSKADDVKPEYEQRELYTV